MLNWSNQTSYHLSLIFVNNYNLSIKIHSILLNHNSNSLNHLIKLYRMRIFVHHRLEISTCFVINPLLFIIAFPFLLFFITLLRKWEHHHHLKAFNFIYRLNRHLQKSSFTRHILVWFSSCIYLFLTILIFLKINHCKECL